MLAKLADLKTMLAIASSAEDARLTLALQAAGAMIEQYCRRTFEYSASDQVRTFDGDVFELRLPVFPIVQPPLARPLVKLACDMNFPAAATLTENTDYFCRDLRGLIVHLPIDTRWPPGGGILQVTWRGGYTDPASTPVSGVSVMPAHVQQACLLQAVELYQRRAEPGYKVVSGMPEGLSTGFAPPVELLPAVKTLIAGERR